MIAQESRNSVFESLTMDWSNVRPIYKKLSDEFTTLTDAFDLKLSGATVNHLDHLLGCIDVVDQIVDEIEDHINRVQLCDEIIRYLHHEIDELSSTHASDQLRMRLSNVRKIVMQRGIVNRFSNGVQIIFRQTELKRHTTDVQQFFDMLAEEGRTTAELPLTILGKEASNTFATFFTKICELMGFADLIIDARSDFRKGQIVIVPNFRFYGKLLIILFRDGLKLLRLIPHKWRFIKYCIRFGYQLLVEK